LLAFLAASQLLVGDTRALITRLAGSAGDAYPTPIVINPVGFQRAIHPGGELAVARASGRSVGGGVLC
jgi:hypothetical protein